MTTAQRPITESKHHQIITKLDFMRFHWRAASALPISWFTIPEALGHVEEVYRFTIPTVFLSFYEWENDHFNYACISGCDDTF